MVALPRSTAALVEACLVAYGTCMRSAMAAPFMPGPALEPELLQLLTVTAEVCRVTAAHWRAGRALADAVSGVCAHLCDVCARYCDAQGQLTDCARDCRRCAHACAGVRS